MEELQNAIAYYYGKELLFTKTANVKGETMTEYSVYKSYIKSSMSGYHYLVAVLYDDGLPVGTQVEISALNWLNFQTRVSNDPKEVEGLTANTVSRPENSSLRTPIASIGLIERDLISFTSPAFPFCVILLQAHGNQRFTNVLTFASALETWSCMLSNKGYDYK